jgi:hypothetical protein
MNRIRFLVLLLAALLITNCSPNPDDDLSADWCYTFRLYEGLQDFSITAGVHQPGMGFVTDGTGLLMFSYGYDRFVEPKFIIVQVARQIGVEGSVTATVQGEIFGVTGGFTGTVAGTNQQVVLAPPQLGMAGNAINVTAEADQPFVVQSIEIRGDGSNPFDRNECDYDNPYNPTPSATPIGTPTSTMTATSTATPSATVTSTPTTTPTLENTPWVCTFDFTVSDGGWLAYVHGGTETRAVYSAGVGWVRGGSGSATQMALVQIRYPGLSAFSLTSVQSFASVAPTNGYQFRMSDVNGADYTSGFFGAGQLSGSDFVGTNGTGMWASAEHPNGNNYLGALTAIVLSGTGANPFTPGSGITCDTPTPTPTPTPTASNTPSDPELTQTSNANATATADASITPTTTPSNRYICIYDFLTSDGGFTAISLNGVPQGTHMGTIGWRGQTTGANQNLWVSRDITSTTVSEIILTWGVTIPSATLAIIDPYNSPPITVDTGTRIQTVRGIWTGATQLHFEASGGAASGRDIFLQRAAIVGEGSPPSGSSCQETTPTPSASRTPLFTTTPPPLTRTPVVPPTLDVTPNYITATPGGPTIPPGTAITSTPGLDAGPASDIGEGLNAVWGVGDGTGRLLGDWANDVGSSLTGLLGSFTDANPEPVPGLPLCMSNPTAHDWCAIIYIIEHTILSDGTPGVLIVPLLQIMVYVYLVIYFVRSILWIVRRGETMTNVS